eukprot:SAG31_NODE_9669_length_1243_cov_4.789336_1_plen_108_part_00
MREPAFTSEIELEDLNLVRLRVIQHRWRRFGFKKNICMVLLTLLKLWQFHISIGPNQGCPGRQLWRKVGTAVDLLNLVLPGVELLYDVHCGAVVQVVHCTAVRVHGP